MILTKIDSFPLIIDYFKKLHLTKISTYSFQKKKIIVNPCEFRSENYMFYVKKSQLFKKNIKLRIEVAEDPQKHIFKVNFRF